MVDVGVLFEEFLTGFVESVDAFGGASTEFDDEDFVALFSFLLGDVVAVAVEVVPGSVGEDVAFEGEVGVVEEVAALTGFVAVGGFDGARGEFVGQVHLGGDAAEVLGGAGGG